MSKRLDDKIVAVIGAGSGIGVAVARQAAAEGATLICLDLYPERAQKTANAIGARSGRIDITNGQETGEVIEELAKEFGRLDGIVATPGYNVRKGILEYSEEEFDRVVSINLKGSFNLLQAAGKVMTQAEKGSIVLFSSIRDNLVEPGQSVYAATKAGVVQLVKTAAAEFGGAGVRVNAIAPGVVETPLTEPIRSHPEWYEAYAMRNVLGRWADPEEIAGPTNFLLSDAASYITGTVLYIDAGWTSVDGRFHPPGIEIPGKRERMGVPHQI